MDQRILVLNQAAKEIYNPTNAERAREANHTFETLSENPANLGLILDYLEHGEKPYAEFIASTTLKRLSEKRISIPLNEQLRLANQLLQFLANQAENADRFTLNKLCDVFANISKYNFTVRDPEDKTYPFRTSLTEVQNALSNVNVQGTLALELLTAVVQAFDVQKPSEGTSEHRVAHNEFQNKFLREFNSIGITQISQVVEMLKKPSGEQPSIAYIRALLEFYRRLLDYEFLGSNFDIEERETVDLPASWRQKILVVYEPIFDLYRLLPVSETTCLKLAIQICSSLASVRRTLFDSEERTRIVGNLLSGILIVLGNVTKLGNPEIFIEFSRFLHRLIRNFTYSDLAKHRSFTNEILPLLSQFSQQAFEAFDTTATNGIFYLLAFWQRISIHASLPIKEDDRVNPLDSIKPIPLAFVQSRMKLCYLSSVGESDNPFDDPVSVLQFMDHFSGLCRVDLAGMALLLKTIFEENTMILSSNEPGTQQYLLAELRLIYWTYICGACLDNRDTVRSSFTTEENPEEFDIVLFMNVNILSKYNFERMQHFTSNEVPSNVIELEVAILSAFDRFRMTYLNESNRYFHEIQSQLVERMGRDSSEDALWEIYTEKIVTNIRVWSTVDEIITKTLSLFGAITSSISLTRKTLNLRTIQFVISNHDAAHFPFLGSLTNKDVLRSRTLFYSSIMRLVVNAIDGNDTIFDEFMKPIDIRVNQIKQCLNQRSGYEQDGLKMAIAGMARDFRGLGEACARLQGFSLLAGYCQKDIYDIFYRAVELFFEDSYVMVSILKCLAEFTANRNARLAFNLGHFRSSAIFMQVAKIVQEICRRFVQLPAMNPEDKMFYQSRLKIVNGLLCVIKNILNGNYLPIALFYSYNDQTYCNLLNTVFRVFTQYAVYSEKYPKVSTLYNDTIYELGRVYPIFVSKMRLEDLAVFFHYLEIGFHANERSKLLNSCTTFERITDIMLEGNTRVAILTNVHTEPPGNSLTRCFEQNPKILENYFNYFMNMLIMDSRPIHYMAGRIIYNIVYLCPQILPKWREEFSETQPMDIQQKFNDVFKDVFTQPFSVNEREVFTVKIEQFQQTLKDASKFDFNGGGGGGNNMDQ